METNSIDTPPLKEMRGLSRQSFLQVVAIVHADGSASAAFARDLNATGIYFAFNSEIPKGSKVDVLVPMTSSHILHCRGTVVRTEATARFGGFGTAVEFDRTETVEGGRGR